MQDVQPNHLIIAGLGLAFWCLHAWETWTRAKRRIGLYAIGVGLPSLILISILLFVVQPATLESAQRLIFNDTQRFFLFNAAGGLAVVLLITMLQLPLWLLTRNRTPTRR